MSSSCNKGSVAMEPQSFREAEVLQMRPNSIRGKIDAPNEVGASQTDGGDDKVGNRAKAKDILEKGEAEDLENGD